MSQIELRQKVIGALFLLFSLAVIIWWEAFLPFVIGIVLAYILDPLVVRLTKTIPRTLAISLVLFTFITVFGFLVFFSYPVLIDGIDSLTRTILVNENKIELLVQDIESWLEEVDLPFDLAGGKVVNEVLVEVGEFLKQFFKGLSSFIISILGSIPMMIIIPLIVFYLLKDKEKIFTSLKKYTKIENEQKIRVIFDEINLRLGGYLKGQLLLSALVALITTIGMWIFGVPYALLIGLSNGVLNIIPYFGPVIGAIPALVLVLINFSSIGHLIGVVLFFVIMNILVATILSPKIFSQATNLHPLLVILALFLGSAIFGMMGMLIAIPVAIIFQTLLRIVFETWIKEL